MNDFDEKFEPRLSGRQKKAWLALQDPEIEEVLFGGAKGGGKSVLLCYWAYSEAYDIAQKYIKKPLLHPIPVGFLGRKVAKDFTRTTLETFKRFIPPHRCKIQGNPAVITVAGRVKILTGGLDTREAIEQFNSAELAFYGIDQAEETLIDDIATLRAASHNRLIINGHKFPGKGLFTANPGQCWLKPEFILNPTKSRRFIQSLPGDNPYLDESYMNTLKDAFKHRPELLQAYLYGNWDAFEGADQVIKDVWLDTALHRRADYWPFIKEYIAIDCARFGDDETVMLLMENTDIKEKIVMPHCRTTEISGKAAALSTQNGKCELVVESTGSDLGAGVVDELIEMGHSVFVYNPQGKPIEKEKYYNIRAEAWSDAAKILCSGIIDKHSNCGAVLTKHGEGKNYGLDDTMRGQLCTPHYKFRKGKIIIEKKEDIKKRLGRSPDHADAYVIALWAWPYMSKKEEQKTTYKKRQAVGSAMEF